MNGLSPAEYRRLVELWRELSPAALTVTVPDLSPELEALSRRSLSRRPRAVLFDVYGTLLVSAAGGEPTLAAGRAEEATLASRLLKRELAEIGFAGGGAALDENLSRSIAERRRAEMARTPHPEVDIERILAELFPALAAARVRRLAILHEASVNPCSLMPGAVALLTRLAGEGLRLGVISNAQFYTPLLVEALFGATLEALGLDARLCLYSYQLKTAKPGTEPFEKAARVLEALNLTTADALFIGNSSVNDIAPARKMGFMTALFAGDSRSFRPSEPGTPGAQPDLVLKSWQELPAEIF